MRSSQRSSTSIPCITSIPITTSLWLLFAAGACSDGDSDTTVVTTVVTTMGAPQTGADLPTTGDPGASEDTGASVPSTTGGPTNTDPETASTTVSTTTAVSVSATHSASDTDTASTSDTGTTDPSDTGTTGEPATAMVRLMHLGVFPNDENTGVDIYADGAEMAGPVPARSVVIYRYYDSADPDLGGGKALSITAAAVPSARNTRMRPLEPSRTG